MVGSALNQILGVTLTSREEKDWGWGATRGWGWWQEGPSGGQGFGWEEGRRDDGKRKKRFVSRLHCLPVPLARQNKAKGPCAPSGLRT